METIENALLNIKRFYVADKIFHIIRLDHYFKQIFIRMTKVNFRHFTFQRFFIMVLTIVFIINIGNC